MSRPTNTQFAIAVHVLTMLAGLPRELQSSEVMASSVGSNPVHIRRVLGRLRAAGLVASRPGPHGGWQLLRSPEETTLADVWRVVNGDDPVLGVHEADPNCPVGRLIQSNLEAIDRRALAAIEAELATTTLAHLAADADPDPAHLHRVRPSVADLQAVPLQVRPAPPNPGRVTLHRASLRARPRRNWQAGGLRQSDEQSVAIADIAAGTLPPEIRALLT